MGAEPLAEDVRAWDYQSKLSLSAVLTVDSDAVREACHLGPRSRLQIVVTAASSTTRMRGPIAIVPVSSAELHVEAELLGHELGGRLSLDTLLVAEEIERTDDLSPRAAGSILWRNRRTTWLEGENPRFPTEVADLGAAPFFTPGALWFLDVNTDDLDSAALGSVRLVLNENHAAVARLLAGDTAPETAVTMHFLRWDVTRQLTLAALDCDEFVERDGVFDDDTIGVMLTAVITTHWPGESARALRELRRSDAARFERELQDRTAVLGD